MISNFFKTFLCIVAISVFTVSCKDNVSKEESIPTVEQESDAQTETSAGGDSHEGHSHDTPSENPNANVALNPAHGQPGHRCDIAVGQPLNSQPKQETNANVNPPHGQPGHRCDLAVGAPLNQ